MPSPKRFVDVRDTPPALSRACDCHVHVFGPIDRFRQLERRAYTAGLAPLDRLRSLANPLGINRFVVVQPSVYGSDNTCLLEALGALGDTGRGVAVIDGAARARTLDDCWRRGVRGLRVNLYSGVTSTASASTSERHINDLVDVTGGRDWHIEVVAPIATLVAAAPILAASPVRIVLDHYGLPGAASPDSAQGRCLLDLAALPHVWVKLSAPYRTASDPLATAPPGAWLRSFIDRAPGRVVWGSDWPHTPPHGGARAGDRPDPFRSLEYSRMFADFVHALGDPAIARAVLADNPARLFGFE